MNLNDDASIDGGEFEERPSSFRLLGMDASDDMPSNMAAIEQWRGNGESSFPDNMASTEGYDRVLLGRTLNPMTSAEEGMVGLVARIRENFPATFTIATDNRVLI